MKLGLGLLEDLLLVESVTGFGVDEVWSYLAILLVLRIRFHFENVLLHNVLNF